MNIIKLSGGLLVFLGLALPLCCFTKWKVSEYQEEVLVEKALSENDYYALLEIEKIGLKKELYPIDSKENQVNQNILLHEESVLPSDADTSHIILAAHSGSGWNAYFRDLYQLEVHDVISLYYQGKRWIYEIQEIEVQDKTGVLYLKEDYPHMISLITCTKNDSSSQTIYYGSLKKTQNL